MRPDVAVVIVSYNSVRHIGECLRSVLDQRRHVNQEVIVVDNNSTDGTVDFIRREFPSVRLLTPGRNLGFAAGVNLGAKASDAEYVLLLNPDTVVLDHAIDVLVEFARAHPHYGIYGGKTVRPDGSLEPSSCWGLPSLWSLTMFATGLSTLARHNAVLDPESLGRWPRDTVREVGVITGCLLLATRAAWERLGGMDERYFLYGEDTDFSMRARRADYRPVICPDSRIVHEVGQSSATPTRKMLMLYRGKACFFRTHYKGLAQFLALFLLLVGVGSRALLVRFAALFGRKGGSSDWIAVWQSRRDWLPGYPLKQ